MLEARGIEVLARSRWFASPAWPTGSGPDYINGAAVLDSDMSAAALLEALHKTEKMLGRVRGPDRWGARPCDLDLIAHGAAVMPGLIAWRRAVEAPPDTPRSGLILPHPLMHHRAFVLAPMADIAPNWHHPVRRQTVSEMLAALPAEDREAMRPL